jgi:hypothetical protein
MPRRLTETKREIVDYVIRELLPHLTHLTVEGPDEVYERKDEIGDEWRVRSHWFPAQPDHSDPKMRLPMLEVSVTLHNLQRKKSFHAWFYHPNTGNDCHPEYENWRVHVHVCRV